MPKKVLLDHNLSCATAFAHGQKDLVSNLGNSREFLIEVWFKGPFPGFHQISITAVSPVVVGSGAAESRALMPNDLAGFFFPADRSCQPDINRGSPSKLGCN